jgi:hypothetical protein
VVAFGAIEVHHEVSAFAFLVTRTFEVVVLAGGAGYTLAAGATGSRLCAPAVVPGLGR